ncbi:MAG: hypothetical protein FWF62_02795 [Candidatus Bathyarchaeota archaeon]|nr:hypothetical protein [Candidatus Termiticorpusculum sp.]
MSEQIEDNVFNEWAFNVWSDSRDWCRQCNKEKNKLVFDDQTKTTKCTKCEHIETYTESNWKILQAKRYVTTHYMPGKYLFNNNLSVEAIFQKYLRELNHADWTSWLLHDYMLAKMKQDALMQDKLLSAAKLTVNKMSYDATPWKSLFEKMNTPNSEMLHQVPQIIYELAEKKFLEVTSKEELPTILQGYAETLNSLYNYNRWKSDRVSCWISSEIIKLCDTESYQLEFDTKYFNCDPILEKFQEDILTGKKRDFNLKDTYIQWELCLADNYIAESKALPAVWSAYKALAAKLGLHTTWPPKTIKFDITTVKKVTNMVNDSELFRFYDLATDLNSVDASKACYYAKYFIKHVQELLPKITAIKQEQTKSTSYIT